MNTYSYVTQKLANYMPSWTKARNDRHSLFQQLIGPIGTELDDITQKARLSLKGKFIGTASLNEIDVIYETRLGANFEVQYDTSDFRLPKLISPTITVVPNYGDTPVEIDVVEGNSIENFWYKAIPNRLTVDATTTSYQPVLAETQIGIGEFTVFNTIYDPGYLFLTISDGTSFVNEETIERAYVKVSGLNRRGIEDTEIIPFTFNTTVVTLKEWESLSSVQVFNIGPSSANIKIDAVNFNYNRYRYDEERYVDANGNEKVLYLNCSESAARSYLNHEVFTASTIDDLLAGINTLHEVYKVKLLDSSESDVTGILDMTVQPDATRCITLTDTKLRVYDTRTLNVDCSGLNGRTSNPEVYINVNSELFVEGDTILLNPYGHLRTKRIIKYKWDLRKPDGSMSTFLYDDSLGEFQEQAYVIDGDYSGWNKNPYELTDPNNFYHRTLEYVVPVAGDYAWTLSIEYLDGERDVDQKIMAANAVTPLVELNHTVANPIGIAFNSDYELCIIDSSNNVHIVALHHDVAMFDVKSKKIYTRESYFSMIVAY